MGHTKDVQLLLSNAQASLIAADSSGWTALHKAANDGHTAVVQLLLDAGAAVDARAPDGRTP
jgi:ankyrin repeat protein